MRKKLLYLLSATAIAATLSAGSLMLAGCGPQGHTDNLTDEPLNATTTVADWSEGEAPAVFESDGWTNGSPFNVQWSSNNVAYENGVAKLTIADNPNGSEETFTEYYGGEMRTYQYFGYGDYEVSMKPSNKPGTASTFFTCTGSYDTNPHTGQPNPWDEIDIEFLGEDTTKVQFNYYVNGVGGHEYMYDLGFDASEDFHTYGFRWTEDYITWFVDGEPVYRVDATESSPMPSTAGRMLMNYWCGSSAAENWMGKFENPDDKGPEYQWVKTSAEVDWGEIPEPVEVEEYEGDWSKIDAASVEFSNSDNGVGTDYKVTPAADGKSAQITYTKAGNYDNVNFNASEAAAEKNWMHLTLKNNSSTATNNIRINIRNAENTATINAFGFGNDSLLVTNAGEGTTISLSPNMTMEVEIKFNGIAGNVELMLDSMQANAVEKASDITISDIKFDIQGELEIPETPVEDNNGVTINGQKVKFDGNVGGQPYAINTDAETNSMNVTYTSAPGASYQNVSADISAIAADKNTFSATVANNGDQAVAIRVDIVAANSVNANTNVCNLSATMDGESVYTDLEWGGSTFNIPAGATVEIEVVFDASYGPSSLQFLIDTATYGDTATHAGDVTFSGMEFSGEGASVDPEPDPDPETPDEPETPGEQPAYDYAAATPVEAPAGGVTTLYSGALTYGGSVAGNNGPYTVYAGNNNTIRVSYRNVAANSYANVSLSGFDFITQRNNVFMTTVTNNGSKTVNIRVNIQSLEAVSANTNACNLFARQDGAEVRTDTEWGGSFFTVEPGKTITIQVVYDNYLLQDTIQFMIDSHMGTDELHSGNITIGELKFFGNGYETVYPDLPVITPDEPGEPETPDEEEPEEPAVVETPVDLGTATIGGTTVENGGPYTATVSGNELNITYDELVPAYQNVEISGITDTIKANDTFTATVTNNGTATVNFRVNITATQVGNNSSCNLSATQNGSAVNTDLDWGGSFFTIAAGETVEIVVVYDNTREVLAVQFMVDSSTSDTTPVSGDITISEMVFSGEAATEPEEPDEEEPSEPAVTPVDLTFTSTEVYTVDKNGVAANSVNVTYAAATANYANIQANVVELAKGNDTFTVTIKNNGEATVNVRVDVIGEKVVSTGTGTSTDVCNQSHQVIGATGGYTDLVYGGTNIDVAAGAELTLVITYDGEGEWGAAQRVQFYFDSSTYGDTATHSGNVTISGFAFSTQA